MVKKFEFIDGTKNDRPTLKLARSHAMKGKNLGKTHQRRSRLDADQRHKRTQLVLLQVCEGQKYGESNNTPVQSSVSLTYKDPGDQLLSVSFPVEVTPESGGVIYHCKYSAA